MSPDVSGDQFVLIRIEGMHCFRCGGAIQKALLRNAGVHEVEVDFPSGQASVLFDRAAVTIPELIRSVQEAGYRAIGFHQGHEDAGSNASSDVVDSKTN